MNHPFTKILILLGLLLYVVSKPLDLFPGPIDDLIVVMVGVAAMKAQGAIED